MLKTTWATYTYWKWAVFTLLLRFAIPFDCFCRMVVRRRAQACRSLLEYSAIDWSTKSYCWCHHSLQGRRKPNLLMTTSVKKFTAHKSSIIAQRKKINRWIETADATKYIVYVSTCKVDAIAQLKIYVQSGIRRKIQQTRPKPICTNYKQRINATTK